MDYLPKLATAQQACNWLTQKTGATWVLQRLLEDGLMPWFWLEYSPVWPVIFGNKIEGYLAPIVFTGDTHRLEADGADALVNMTHTHDGKLFKLTPAMRVPLTDLRFKREDLERTADAFPKQKAKQAEPQQETVTPEPMQEATETPAERRTRWLAMFEEEEKRGKRGALQRLADKEGVDRSNMSKAIDKARAERGEQKRAGLWSQLVKDGKRQV